MAPCISQFCRVLLLKVIQNHLTDLLLELPFDFLLQLQKKKEKK